MYILCRPITSIEHDLAMQFHIMTVKHQTKQLLVPIAQKQIASYKFLLMESESVSSVFPSRFSLMTCLVTDERKVSILEQNYIVTYRLDCLAPYRTASKNFRIWEKEHCFPFSFSMWVLKNASKTLDDSLE